MVEPESVAWFPAQFTAGTVQEPKAPSTLAEFVLAITKPAQVGEDAVVEATAEAARNAGVVSAATVPTKMNSHIRMRRICYLHLRGKQVGAGYLLSSNRDE
jgi:hypothetical protein